jgi:NhaP-type Na+/H+ or K+/H+ antiporter
MKGTTRNTSTVLAGIALGFLLTILAALLFCRVSGHWSEAQLGAAGRYVASPLIAVLLGACVGGLAKVPPGVAGMIEPSSVVARNPGKALVNRDHHLCHDVWLLGAVFRLGLWQPN